MTPERGRQAQGYAQQGSEGDGSCQEAEALARHLGQDGGYRLSGGAEGAGGRGAQVAHRQAAQVDEGPTQSPQERLQPGHAGGSKEDGMGNEDHRQKGEQHGRQTLQRRNQTGGTRYKAACPCRQGRFVYVGMHG